MLEALKERGEVVSKIAYGDWTRAGDYSRSLTQHATKLVQRNLTPGGDKNGADINLALDALEMAFTHTHINAYVIVGGDSDFITLVEKLKQYDKQIFVVGGRAFTSVVMQRNCHEFIAYENLVGSRRGPDRGRQPGPVSGQAPIEQVVPLVRRALKVLSDREVSPQLGLLKSTLLQLDSTFSERTYGVGSFRDFAQKLANAGHVRLREHGRNVLVELADGDGQLRVEDATRPPGLARRRSRIARAPAARDAARPREPANPRIRGAAAGRSEPAAGRRAARGRRDSRRAAHLPVGAQPAAVPDVRAAGQAVHARRRPAVRRTQVRVRDAAGPAARLPARRPVPASNAIGRASSGCSPATSCSPSTGADDPEDEDDLQPETAPRSMEGARRDGPAIEEPAAVVAEPPNRSSRVTRMCATRAGGRPEVVDGDVVQELDEQQVVDGEEAPPVDEGSRGAAAAAGSAPATPPKAAKKTESAAPRARKTPSRPRAPRPAQDAVGIDSRQDAGSGRRSDPAGAPPRTAASVPRSAYPDRPGCARSRRAAAPAVRPASVRSSSFTARCARSSASRVAAALWLRVTVVKSE